MSVSFNPSWKTIVRRRSTQRQFCERLGVRGEFYFARLSWGTALSRPAAPYLTKEPKLLLNDNDAGKPESIHLMIGQRPHAAFGNSTGDRQMLEYTGAGDGARLMMLVMHDDDKREYAYGPAQGLPNTKVGTFTQQLYNEDNKKGWTVISMKNDWKRVFAFEP